MENQMRNLGISTLFSQTYVGETAEAKAMDRSDSDSMLSVVSQDLARRTPLRWLLPLSG